jgi:hypothetical protein
MWFAVIEMPNCVPVTAGTSWIRLLDWSLMNRSPEPSSARPHGTFSSADVAGPPLPDFPDAPVGLPATTYACPAVIEIPNCAWAADATSTTSLVPASAYSTSPAASSTMSTGSSGNTPAGFTV